MKLAPVILAACTFFVWLFIIVWAFDVALGGIHVP